VPTTKLYLDGGIFTKKYYTDTSNNTIQFGSAYELFGTSHSAEGYKFFINPVGWSSSWNLAIGNLTNNITFDYTGITTLKVTSTDLSLGGVFNYYKSSPATGFSFLSGNGWDFVLRGTSDEKLRVKANGNLLINTTTDNGGKLQIKAPGALSTDIALRVRNSADTGDLMTVNGLGNVGIGISPSYKLDVNGNSRVLNNFILQNNSGATGTGYAMEFATDSSAPRVDFVVNGIYTGQFSAVGNDINFKNSLNNTGTINFFTKISGSESVKLKIFNTGNVVIGGTVTDIASSKLTVESTTQGFLPPRMTNAQRLAIATPAIGLVIYDTTLGKLCVRGAAAWETITSI